MGEKKFGQGKVDPQKQRGMNEKITDGARGMFEKATVRHFFYLYSVSGQWEYKLSEGGLEDIWKI